MDTTFPNRASAPAIPSNRRSRRWMLDAVVCLFCMSTTPTRAEPDQPSEQRAVTVDDIVHVRSIDTLSLSPDGQRFAIFVRMSDPHFNEYDTAWMTGSIDGGALTSLGKGGHVGPEVKFTGTIPGAIETRSAQWSPDGQWIAYPKKYGSEVQLWRSKADGSLQEQLTEAPADVREFAWSEDGSALIYSTGRTRAELEAEEERRYRQGYRYDEDISSLYELMQPRLPAPPEANERSIWRINLEDRSTHAAPELEHALSKRDGRSTIKEAVLPPTARRQGGWAWLALSQQSSGLRLRASLFADGQKPIDCTAPACTGTIKQIWWSEDGKRVLIWRNEGINDTENAFYAWNPSTQRVTELARLRDDELQLCALGAQDRLVCVCSNALHPDHLIALDLRQRNPRPHIIADVNSEFRPLRLGRVERFEWDTPTFAWNEPGGELAGLYSKRAYGYILYPPDFDPSKKYPVFIDPYVAHGFKPLGAEHALHAYTASGFIVLRTAFPREQPIRGAPIGMKQLYSKALGFPRLTFFMESTLRGLDTVVARGFIDPKRVGIGGVSHGTFVSLHMMQKHDRIAAISISSATWDPLQYYASTRKVRDLMARFKAQGYEDWAPKPEGEGREFWRDISIADHLDTIEAPILMQLSAHETYALQRFLRHLDDAKKPYDAYIFPEETHIKWQPSHLHTIMQRNLDWFRFWLQDYEDPDADKQAQYQKWRSLREQRQAAPAAE